MVRERSQEMGFRCRVYFRQNYLAPLAAAGANVRDVGALERWKLAAKDRQPSDRAVRINFV
jgi:hypothetical protein